MTHFRGTSVHKHWKDTYNYSEAHLYTNTGKTHTITHFSSTSVHKHWKDTYNDSEAHLYTNTAKTHTMTQRHICTQTLQRHIQ